MVSRLSDAKKFSQKSEAFFLLQKNIVDILTKNASRALFVLFDENKIFKKINFEKYAGNIAAHLKVLGNAYPVFNTKISFADFYQLKERISRCFVLLEKFQQKNISEMPGMRVKAFFEFPGADDEKECESQELNDIKALEKNIQLLREKKDRHSEKEFLESEMRKASVYYGLLTPFTVERERGTPFSLALRKKYYDYLLHEKEPDNQTESEKLNRVVHVKAAYYRFALHDDAVPLDAKLQAEYDYWCAKYEWDVCDDDADLLFTNIEVLKSREKQLEALYEMKKNNPRATKTAIVMAKLLWMQCRVECDAFLKSARLQLLDSQEVDTSPEQELLYKKNIVHYYEALLEKCELSGKDLERENAKKTLLCAKLEFLLCAIKAKQERSAVPNNVQGAPVVYHRLFSRETEQKKLTRQLLEKMAAMMTDLKNPRTKKSFSQAGLARDIVAARKIPMFRDLCDSIEAVAYGVSKWLFDNQEAAPKLRMR